MDVRKKFRLHELGLGEADYWIQKEVLCGGNAIARMNRVIVLTTVLILFYERFFICLAHITPNVKITGRG
jgi:hypothetical protein